MGSFTSTPKVLPAGGGASTDDDVTYPGRDERAGDGAAYARELAATRLGSLPPPLPRHESGDSVVAFRPFAILAF